FLNLMVADLIQATGGLLNIKWVINASITEGPLCLTQGVLKQVGDVGVALTIAVQTFSVLALRWHMPQFVSRILIAVIWIFIFLAVTVGELAHKGHYYGNTGYWCWILAQYRSERIALEYFWMWFAAFLMLILYGILALVMRGVISIHSEDVEDRLQEDEDGNRIGGTSLLVNDDEEQQAKAIAGLMLFYPAVYIICIVPAATVRWLVFNGHNVPAAATVFGSIIFSLSGFFNGMLYRYTRPELVTGPKDDIIATVHDRTVQSDSFSQSSQSSGPKGLGYLPAAADFNPSPSTEMATIHVVPAVDGNPRRLQPQPHSRAKHRGSRSKPGYGRRDIEHHNMTSIGGILSSDRSRHPAYSVPSPTSTSPSSSSFPSDRGTENLS
ncbi:hypothetical protein BDN72DRAFT_767748, partial [Pluteus cervinus]